AGSARTRRRVGVPGWRVGLDVRASRLGELSASLSSAERERAARFRFERHRDRWAAARGTLRAILAGYLQRAPETFELMADVHGKPFLRDGDRPAPLRFNLAHADGVALVAVAWPREVGVDIERETPQRADPDLAPRMLAP